jgi:hypothetical protein
MFQALVLMTWKMTKILTIRRGLRNSLTLGSDQKFVGEVQAPPIPCALPIPTLRITHAMKELITDDVQ